VADRSTQALSDLERVRDFPSLSSCPEELGQTRPFRTCGSRPLGGDEHVPHLLLDTGVVSGHGFSRAAMRTTETGLSPCGKASGAEAPAQNGDFFGTAKAMP
jgi:hypothetical protein